MLLSLLTIGCLVAGCDDGAQAKAEGKGQNGGGNGGGPPAVPVTTIKARGAEMPDRVEGVGELRASQMALIAPEVSGTIKSIKFDDGQQVKKGKLLFTLINDEEKADLAAAKANYNQKQYVYQQQQNLLKNNAGTTFQATQAKLARDSAKAQVKQAQAALRKTRVTAPFSGQLGVRRHDAGDFLSSGQPMVRLAKDNPILVDYYLSGQYAGKLDAGQKIIVTSGKPQAGAIGSPANDEQADSQSSNASKSSESSSKSMSGQSDERGSMKSKSKASRKPKSMGSDKSTQMNDSGKSSRSSDSSGKAAKSQTAGSPEDEDVGPTGFAGVNMPTRMGKAIAMSPGINSNTRSIRLRGRLPNPDHELIPGRFVRVAQQIGSRPNAVLVPQEALVHSATNQGSAQAAVYTVKAGKAHQLPITLGEYVGSDVIVTSGLEAGQKIVLTGAQTLREGVAIRETKIKPIRKQTTQPMESATGSSSSASSSGDSRARGQRDQSAEEGGR